MTVEVQRRIDSVPILVAFAILYLSDETRPAPFGKPLMKRLLALVFLPATLAQADDEITIELPGGVPLEMVWIEPGNFTMGSPEYDGTREVTISHGFYLGKYPAVAPAQVAAGPGESSMSGRCTSCERKLAMYVFRHVNSWDAGS